MPLKELEQTFKRKSLKNKNFLQKRSFLSSLLLLLDSFAAAFIKFYKKKIGENENKSKYFFLRPISIILTSDCSNFCLVLWGEKNLENCKKKKKKKNMSCQMNQFICFRLFMVICLIFEFLYLIKFRFDDIISCSNHLLYE